MTTRKMIMATMASALVLGTLGGAYAASGAKPNNEVVAAMAAAKPLSDAIKIAEGATKGNAFEGSLEDEDGAAVYEITTVTGDLVTEVSIDPTTGKVLETDEEGVLAKLIRDDRALAGLATSKTDLLTAIAAAEHAAGGRAIEADLDDESAQPVFEIEVANAEGAVKKIYVDGVSGAVLKAAPDNDRDNGVDHDGDDDDDDG